MGHGSAIYGYCSRERLLVRISVQLGCGAVCQAHRRVILFEAAEEFIEQLLGAGRSLRRRACTEISQLLCLPESQSLFEFFYRAHK